MKRNINKAVAEGETIRNERPELDIYPDDVLMLQQQRPGIDAIIAAYYAGLAVGMREKRHG